MIIINRNLFRLLRSSAFHTTENLEPMSVFKWQRLVQIAEKQDVLPYIHSSRIEGFSHAESFHSKEAPLTDDSHNKGILSVVESEGGTASPEGDKRMISVDDYTRSITEANPELSNILLKWKMKRMKKREEENPDTTPETWQLMLIIINNVNQTLTQGISLRGIIELGRFLRQKGQNVDFILLESWLHKLDMMRMASLQGSILVNFFNFDDDEIPFMHQQEKAATRLVERSLTHTAADTAENWHFRMRTNGMVQNNSKVLRRNLRRSFKYLRYNPIETTSNFLANFAKTLSEIEE